VQNGGERKIQSRKGEYLQKQSWDSNNRALEKKKRRSGKSFKTTVERNQPRYYEKLRRNGVDHGVRVDRIRPKEMKGVGRGKAKTNPKKKKKKKKSISKRKIT